jgi:hypothetical protein
VPKGDDMTEYIRDELGGKIRGHCVKIHEEYLSVVLSLGDLGVLKQEALPKQCAKRARIRLCGINANQSISG